MKNKQKLKTFLLIIVVFIGTIDISYCSEQQQLHQQLIQTDVQYPPSQKYHRLLSIQRQILMTEQMLKLYQERLQVLKQIKRQTKNSLQSQIVLSSKQPKPQNRQNSQVQKSILKQSFSPSHQNVKDKSLYLLLSEYNIQFPIHSNNNSNEDGKYKDKIILQPPFIINLSQKYVTVISQLERMSISDNDENRVKLQVPNKQLIYQYGRNSNRMLFYWKEEKRNQLQNTQNQNITLQIKPNKIKNVKITYQINNFKNKFTNQTLSTNPQQSIESQKFLIQQTITSYQSHQLISTNFKWHKSLQFQDLLIGYEQNKILIKSKEKRIHQIYVKFPIIEIYSLNQYKVLFITQKTIGTVNVRSLLILQEIKYEHYLGNKTLIEQRKNQQIKEKNGQADQSLLQSQEQNYIYNQKKGQQNSYWHSIKTKDYKDVRCISSYHIQLTKQTLLLLSNGDLLLYEKQKIQKSLNLGKQLSKKLNINLQSKTHNSQIKMKIRPIEPNYNFLLIYSNIHNKVLIYNINIPSLSIIKGSGGWFSSGYSRSNQFNAKYHMKIKFSSPNQKTAFVNFSSTQYQKVAFYPFISTTNFLFSLTSHQFLQQQLKSLITPNSKQQNKNHLIIYSVNQLKQDHNYLVQEYRLIVDVFSNSGLANVGGDISAIDGSDYNNKQGGKNYFWNIFMVFIVIAGVMLFRKFRKHAVDDEEAKNRNIYSSVNSKIGKGPLRNNNSNLTTKQKLTPSSSNPPSLSTNTKQQQFSTQALNQNIISQLQSYLQKQGQKLSKQQLSQLILQFQEQQQNPPFQQTTINNNNKSKSKGTNKMRRQQQQQDQAAYQAVMKELNKQKEQQIKPNLNKKKKQ